MKLAKKTEIEIQKVYNAYWDGYLKGDVKSMAMLLDYKYTQVGSAESEVFFNKKNAVQFLYDTIDQVAGRLEMRNRKITSEVSESGVLINEFCNLYALADKKWVFYTKFRASTFMMEKKGKWKIIHQHSSFPDTRTEDGGNIAIEKIAEENLQLREAVKRRTIELEQKNRELEIEGALERVRAVAMGMHKPDDLMQICKAVYVELQALGFSELRNTLIDTFVDEENYFIDYDYSEFTGGTSSKIPYSGNPVVEKYIKDIRKSGESFSEITVKGEELDAWKNFRRDNGEIEDSRLNDLKALYYYKYSIGPGGIGISTYSRISKEKLDILHQFRNVFNLSYQRYTDITKAEAQAKEAQIELGLERVRAKAMAMRSSDELKELIGTVFTELTKLDLTLTRCIIWVFDAATNDARWWMANSEEPSNPINFFIKYHGHPAYLTFVKAWKEQNKQLVYDLKGKDKNMWDEMLFNETELKFLPDVVKDGMRAPERVLLSGSFNNFGGINTASLEPLSNEHFDILLRFAKVFDLTYTRFLDLQKAESQAREAKIEAALEKVRSRSLSMHKSNEIIEVVNIVSEKLYTLQLNFDSVTIVILKDNTHEYWVSTNQETYSTAIMEYDIGKNPSAIAKDFTLSRLAKKGLAYCYSFADKNIYWQYMFEHTDFKNISKDRKDFILSQRFYNFNAVFQNQVSFVMVRYYDTPYNETETAVIQRFCNVFEQAYTRFLDLQKAEAQARESEIEAALERVRSRTMAMHSSTDVSVAANTVFAELKNLGIHSLRSGVGLLSKNSRMAAVYATTSSNGKDSLALLGEIELAGHEVYDGQYNAWLKKEMYISVLKGDELEAYYTTLNKTFSLTNTSKKNEIEYGYYFPFSEGLMYSWSVQAYTASEIKILNRFVSIIDLTFRRYIELQNAEKRSVIAVREASLDRVRGEISSMRIAEDLQRITPLVWRELTTLGVPFFRCGLFIVDEPLEIIHFYLSTPDGKPLAALELPFNSINVTEEALVNWRLRKVYTTHWSKEQFISFAKSLFEQGQIKNTSTYQGGGEAPESLALQFIPFTQGMLYVGSENILDEVQIESVKALAGTFSTAYARYEDFIKLELAKQKIEKTFEELKATQSQLIQSEKMASLGELTAGIAHEIQNPLNFVNNFSEVNKELLLEMKDEIDKGNLEEVKALAKDVIENEEKINHHGKRADAIVKGMLQHSRSSSGQKEPTDINALCDEYFRLAYHGLRAKDKSFNATMKTDFDESIGTVNIIPQDIGRAILNLITNAFYAVEEKFAEASAKADEVKYKPTVLISTKKSNGKVEISVKDNGNGIPQKILDKIFQPFFTTKPTGQGTGLGLSLSYDIVKAHGGELKVETKETAGLPAEASAQAGSTFIIQLPM